MTQTSVENDIALVWNYLAAAEEPHQADAIFVFGGLDLAVPHHAAALYDKGFSSTILVTGNAGLLSKEAFKEPEAVVFQNEMIREGVPASAILTETRATNTQENVLFGVSLLKNLRPNARTLLLVAKPFLMRRCIATFQKHAPDFQVTSTPPLGDWHKFIDRKFEDFALRLPAEVTRLEEYPQRGFIAPLVIPPAVQEASQRISAHFA